MNSFIKLNPKKNRINKLFSQFKQFNRNSFNLNENLPKTFYINKIKTINNNSLLNSISNKKINQSKKLNLTNNISKSFSASKINFNINIINNKNNKFSNEKDKLKFFKKNPGFLYYKEIINNIKFNKLKNYFVKNDVINNEIKKENSMNNININNNILNNIRKIKNNKLYNFKYKSNLLSNNNYFKKLDFINSIKFLKHKKIHKNNNKRL